MLSKRHLHIVLSSEFVGRVDMVADMAVMLRMKPSSDDTSHHLLRTERVASVGTSDVPSQPTPKRLRQRKGLFTLVRLA